MEKLEVTKIELKMPEKSLVNLKDALRSFSLSGRTATAHTKTRGEVSGGGKKPWRQKGTGRARVGSSRTPVWRKGGIVFGPRSNRNFTRKINKQVVGLALNQALGLASQSGRVWELKTALEVTKTKDLLGALARIEQAKGRVLLVVSEEASELVLASRNLDFVTVVTPATLSATHISTAHSIIFLPETFKQFEAKLSKDNA